MMPFCRSLMLLYLCFIPVVVSCDEVDETVEAEPRSEMNNARLDEIIRRLDENTEGEAGSWRFSVADLSVMVITDENHDRMRIIIPIIEIAELQPEVVHRLMQANFDSTLDARYAFARGVLWSAYIHPLASLTDHEFLTGLGQTVNLVTNFGSSYSSGLLIYGGGDSKALQDKALIEELLDRGMAI